MISTSYPSPTGGTVIEMVKKTKLSKRRVAQLAEATVLEFRRTTAAEEAKSAREKQFRDALRYAKFYMSKAMDLAPRTVAMLELSKLHKELDAEFWLRDQENG